MTKMDAEFRQRILASSRGPVDPELYEHLFDIHDHEEHHLDITKDGTLMVNSDADLEALLEILESQDMPFQDADFKANDVTAQDTLQWAQDLGFAID